MVLSIGLEPDLKSVAQYLTTGVVKAHSSKFAQEFNVRKKNYVMYEGKLYRRTAKGLRFIPEEKEQIVIMKSLHNEIGHWDFATAYKIATDRFWWPRMRPDIAHFVRSAIRFRKRIL